MATTDAKKGMGFYELIGAAHKAAAEHEQARLDPEPSEQLRRKRAAAEAYAASLRERGVPEGEIPHLLILQGYGGLA